VSWDVSWDEPAVRDLRRLDRQTAERIRAAVRRLAASGQGDLKHLTGQGGELRLRVGDWRVRLVFHHATHTIEILRVLPRGRAYRD
jgi:mRNA-degrading endonuclease RelE of RelBE toxin-antitoxin system